MCNNTFHTDRQTAIISSQSKIREFSTLSTLDTPDSCVFQSCVNVQALSLVWFRRPIINTKVGHRCLGSPRSLRPQTRLTASSMETFLIFSTSKIMCSFHFVLQGHECSLQSSMPCHRLGLIRRTVIVK